MGTTTRTIRVVDRCSFSGERYSCGEYVSGDTSRASYTVTSSGTDPCCSGSTQCLIKPNACPYVFNTVSWDKEFTISGVKYTFVSATGTQMSSVSTATYEYEEPKVQVEITIIHHYGSLTMSGTTTAYVGDRITPSSYKVDRAGYIYDHSNPSGTFTVTTATNQIDLYYVRDVTQYTVTIYYRLTASGPNISNKTIVYDAGETIDSVLAVASLYCPSGYDVVSVSPTRIVNIDSNETVIAIIEEETPEPVYYTVTIEYALSGGTVVHTKTLSYQEGSSIASCLTVANTYCPTGYEVKSVSPTSISNITSNRKIEALVEEKTLPKLSKPSAELVSTHDGYCIYRVYNSNSVSVALYNDDERLGTIDANSNDIFHLYGTNDRWNQAFLHFEASGYQNSDDYIFNYMPKKIQFNFTVNNVGGVVNKECNLGAVPYEFHSSSISITSISFVCQKDGLTKLVKNWSTSKGTIESVEIGASVPQQNFVTINFASPITITQDDLEISITYTDVVQGNYSVSGVGGTVAEKMIVYSKSGSGVTLDGVPFDMEYGVNYYVGGVTFYVTGVTGKLSNDTKAWNVSRGNVASVGVEMNGTTAQVTLTFNNLTLFYSNPTFNITYTKVTKTLDFSVKGVGGVVDKLMFAYGGSHIVGEYDLPMEIEEGTSYIVQAIYFVCQNDEVDNDLEYWSTNKGVISAVEVSHNTVQQNEVKIAFSNMPTLDYYNPTLTITFDKPEEVNYTYSLYSNIEDIDNITLSNADKSLYTSELVVGTNRIFKYAGDSVAQIEFETSEDLTYEQVEVYYGNRVAIEPYSFHKTQSGNKFHYEIEFVGSHTVYNGLYISINKIDISYTVNLLYVDKDKPLGQQVIEHQTLLNVIKGTTLDPLTYIKDIAGYEYINCDPSVPTIIEKIETFTYYYEKKKGKKYKVTFTIENINNVQVNCEYNGMLKDYSFVGTATINSHSILNIEKIVSTDELEDIAMNLTINAMFKADGYNDSQMVIQNATYTPIE